MKKYGSLRNNKHLIRIVRTENSRTPYTMGNAYANECDTVDATTRRLRILDHWGIQNQSPRRPEPPTSEGILPTRNQSSLFFDLGKANQALLSRRNAGGEVNRRDARPGTKQRLHRGTNNFELCVESYSTISNHNDRK